MRFPPLLAAGARVALLSPAGPIRDDAELERAKANARQLGWEPVVMPNTLAPPTDISPAPTSNAPATSTTRSPTRPSTRSGASAADTARCDCLTPSTTRPSHEIAKPLIGYSDVTALHSAFGRLANVVTFHGPTARQNLPPFSTASLKCALTSNGTLAATCPPRPRSSAAARAARSSVATSHSSAALVGTPYAPDYSGAIIVIEDVNEAHYRIDRMLTQLRLSGAFAACAGIVFGHFTDIPKEFGDDTWTLPRVLADTAARAGVPCVAGAPFGHIDAQWTIPLGARAELDADARTLTVSRS